LLCPQGANTEHCRDVIESATDVAALPGKLADDRNSAILNQVAQSLGELAFYQYSPRNSQWQMESKNALLKVAKSSHELQEAIDDLTTQRKYILGNCFLRFSLSWT
jgi:tellurite resistance protein